MSKLKVRFYRDTAKHWRWTGTASNGRIVAASTEGYVKRVDAVRNFQRLVGGHYTIEYVED